MSSSVVFRDLGLIDYPSARSLQLQLNLDRQADLIPDTILICEHPSVITLGRGFLREPSPLNPPSSVPVIEVERGGLATYHGPGQLVIYPIVKIERKSPIRAKHGVVDLIRFLELWVIETLKNYGVEAQCIPEKTGVWTRDSQKIASIGIALKRWVSMHGLAVNLSVNSEAWTWLNPCGFSAQDMTDLQKETAQNVSTKVFADSMKLTFRNLWKQDLIEQNTDCLAPSVI